MILGVAFWNRCSSAQITFELTVKQLMSVDPGEWTEGLRKEYLLLIEGFFSVPVPFSFTTYGRALQVVGGGAAIIYMHIY